jgi:hypothetical protein
MRSRRKAWAEFFGEENLRFGGMEFLVHLGMENR